MILFLLLFTALLPFNGVSGGVLYPWGPSSGDSLLPPPPPPNATHPLPSREALGLQLLLNLTLGTFTYFGQPPTTSLILNKQGFISLNGGESDYISPSGINSQTTPPAGVSTVWIFPLLAEIDPAGGSLSYRETTNRSLLLQVSRDIKGSFPSLKDVALDWALVVTWANLSWWEPPYYTSPNCSCSPKTNTFQTVLASSGPRSWVVFNYDKVTWVRNPWSEWEGAKHLNSANTCPIPPSPSGVRDVSAVAGFSIQPSAAGDLNPYHILPGPPQNISERSNTSPEVRGRWIFRVDERLQSNPCDFADAIEQVRVEPDVICQLGQVPLRIRGPCFLNVTNVECRFHEGGASSPLITKGVVGGVNSSHVTCPAPILQTSNARVRLELAFTRIVGVDGVKEDRSYNGYFFTYPPTSGRRLSLDIGSDGDVRLSWDPASFPGPTGSSLLLQLTLVLLDFSGGASVPPGETKIRNSVFNTGSHTWSLLSSGLFSNPKAGCFVYLTPVGGGGEDGREATPPPTYLHSDIVYTSLATSRENYAKLCDEWYAKDPGMPDNLPPDNMPLCPPLLDQALFDSSFYREDTRPGARPSFRSRLPTPSGACQRCTYSPEGEGRLITDPPEAGLGDLTCSDRSLLSHQVKDVLPLHFCRSAATPESLAKYVDRRRSQGSNGVGWLPPRSSFWRGDPHFTTWDNASFTFNPVGEFWLVKSQDFVVQGRMTRYGRSNGSVLTGFAFSQRSPSTQIQVSLSGTGLRAWLGRDEIDPLTPSTALNPAPISINSPGVSLALHKPGLELERVTLAFSAGLTFDLSLIPGETALNVRASVSPSLRNKSGFSGLLGDYDGMPGNDLRYAPGTGVGALPTNPSLGDVHLRGLTWRITAAESVFLYQSGKSHADLQNENFAPNLGEVNSSSFPRGVLEVCGGLRECLWDYGTTGSLALARGTKEMSLVMEDVEQVFRRKPPLPCTAPHCVPDVSHYTPRPTTPFNVGTGVVTDSHGGVVTTKKPPVPGTAVCLQFTRFLLVVAILGLLRL